MNQTTTTKKTERRRYRLLHLLEGRLETPMFLLSFLWLYYMIKELVASLSRTEEILVGIIWILFILEFLLKIWLAKNKWVYIKQNWLTTLGLIVPAFRMFRLLQALRVLRASRVVSTTKFIRALSSTKRLIGDLKEIEGTASLGEMNVGVFLTLSPIGDKEGIKMFGRRLCLPFINGTEACRRNHKDGFPKLLPSCYPFPCQVLLRQPWHPLSY